MNGCLGGRAGGGKHKAAAGSRSSIVCLTSLLGLALSVRPVGHRESGGRLQSETPLVLTNAGQGEVGDSQSKACLNSLISYKAPWSV